ncbi:MAG: cation-translocating P-type ATPase [Thermodesulfobacteriota bacterium]
MEKQFGTGQQKDGMNWHLMETAAALAELQSSDQNGLDATEARDRQGRSGYNELIEKGARSPWRIFWEQITATMVLILLAAAVAAGFLGDTKNAVAITAIVVLFTILGFFQEYRAEKAIASLKRMSTPNVRVIRDGILMEIPARELVPGDIIALEAGNVVPADVRLTEAVNLRIQEAALTGESEPIEKQTAALAGDDLPLGDRRNMAYMGTIVTQGRGRALVVATGMQTELGKIANLIQRSATEQTPLQRRLDQLGNQLAVIGGVIALLIFGLGIWRGDDVRHMLLTAISVAVAIIPEGLPAVVTITLALGAQRMLRHHALIRKLPAVETLGSVTVICSDKTGTLTENRMTVVVLDVAGHEIDLTEDMKKDSVRLMQNTGIPSPSPLSLLAVGGVLCNDARLVMDGDDKYHTIGDPTEGALIAAAARLGYWKSSLDADFPRVAELPFDSDRKRMTTVHRLQAERLHALTGWNPDHGEGIAFVKGSVDGLLGISSRIEAQGTPQPMDDGWRTHIQTANERLARKGMRVLGLAYRLVDPVADVRQDDLERDLVFVGLFGMIDPPRPEVREAVRVTRTAGIRTVMITGDHPLTALEIARQLGISENGRALTGKDIDSLPFDNLKSVLEDVCVFARVSPEHKLTIVQALQEKGHIVSMTGDGVNDAPALRKADIGVAMGITGTDVSKEAADMVLMDDNFATIVAAVKEGRTIYDNIRKFVRFSVAGNIGKVLVMLLAPFLGKPVPLLPLQLLWLNLMTDGLLGLGLGVEPAEKDTMNRPPYSPQEGVFNRGAGMQTALNGLMIGGMALAVGAWYYFRGHANWQTMVFTSLTFVQIAQALASRSSGESLFRIGIRSNPLMLGMILAVVVLQLLVIYVPPLQTIFNTVPLAPMDLGITAGIGVLFLVMTEVQKVRRKSSKP